MDLPIQRTDTHDMSHRYQPDNTILTTHQSRSRESWLIPPSKPFPGWCLHRYYHSNLQSRHFSHVRLPITSSEPVVETIYKKYLISESPEDRPWPLHRCSHSANLWIVLFRLLALLKTFNILQIYTLLYTVSASKINIIIAVRKPSLTLLER